MIKLRDKTAAERLEALALHLNQQDCATLKETHFDQLDLANTLIENAVGYLAMPFAIAPGITINNKIYSLIPLATEETSIVAGLSKNNRFVSTHGTITASVQGSTHIGQIHIPILENPESFPSQIMSLKNMLIDKGNQYPANSMFKRGGGIKDIEIRLVPRPDGKVMGIIHILIDTKDAMGANIINQTCEYLKPLIEEGTGEKILMCILSNLNTTKITHIEIQLENVDETLATRIAEASLIAQCDPYRAATHNKGIMNGIDAVCLATGNDWRALEASMHAYAARDGQYRGLSQWRSDGHRLVGKLSAPISMGVIGGATRNHPMAALALRCLNVADANELAYVTGAIGLIQNLAALRALVTDGIVKGHMGLHVTNLIQQTDATPQEHEVLIACTRQHLAEKKYITLSDVQEYIRKIRQ